MWESELKYALEACGGLVLYALNNFLVKVEAVLVVQWHTLKLYLTPLHYILKH